MPTRRLVLAALAAALAVATLPALAQHHDAKPGAAAAAGIAEGKVQNGVRVFDMKVTSDGFVPDKVKVKKGERTRFVITRLEEKTCATEVVIKEHGINQPLPLNKAVTVEFTPKKSGETKYACAMGHVTGVIFVP